MFNDQRAYIHYIYVVPWLLHVSGKWKIGLPQFSSTALCPKLVVQFGSIVGLFAAALVWLIFSSCLSAYHSLFAFRVPEECLFSYIVVWFS